MKKVTKDSGSNERFTVVNPKSIRRNMAVQIQLIALAALVAESEALLGAAGKTFFSINYVKIHT